MANMIQTKAVSGSETVYKNFYNDDNLARKEFVKNAKGTFVGWDSLRVVKSA